METFASPDFPAYICYLIVLVVGLLVALSKVNRLMASSPGRWGFLGTWWVFAAYAAVPVLLFWFLDYTNALHDSALFSALVVAIGYRQILAGEMKGVAAPGQISNLWSPFESWANTVRDLIVTKSKLHSDRFAEKVRAYLAAEPDRVESLVELAYRVTTDATQLTASLATLTAEQKPAEITQEAFERVRIRRKVEQCLQTARAANPEDYGFDLLRAGLIDKWQYGFWLGNAAAIAKQAFGFLCLFGLIIVIVVAFRLPAVLDVYYRWRFAKLNATEQDRFRTREYYANRMADAAKKNTADASCLIPLMRLLSYRDLDHRIGDDILRMVVENHGSSVDSTTIPVLIEALRTENSDMRLRIHQTLTALRKLDFVAPPKDDELAAWIPSKEDSAEMVETEVNKYRDWWSKSEKISSPAP